MNIKKLWWQWIVMAVFISFDNIYSYFAIAYHRMREWNKITAFFVSLNPLFYFVSIPLTLFFIYSLIKIAGYLTMKFEKSSQKMREMTEKIILTSLVIAWGIGVTSFNFITLLNGFSNPSMRYNIFLITGILFGAAYGIYMGHRIKRRGKKIS